MLVFGNDLPVLRVQRLTNEVVLTATDSSAKVAQAFVTAWAMEFINFQKEQRRSRVDSTSGWPVQRAPWPSRFSKPASSQVATAACA